ncbi:MAG: mevalonate kinase [Candidatus Brocadiia bacterium]
MIIRTRAHARAGLLGNPSDGFYGKTISFIIKNFTARVTLYESPELNILHESREDRSHFRSLDDLIHHVSLYGYYGGIRLIKAAIKTFAQTVEERHIKLPRRNFTIQYRSNIPRLVGMGGSSAIVTATIRALMRFYDIELPTTDVPSVVLAAEAQELGIPAGLQDRVIQTYEGVVYMDFDRQLMHTQGHGRYEPLPKDCLPQVFVAYRAELAEGSEVVHSGLRSRFERGEPQVLEAMGRWAGLAEQGRQALLDADTEALGRLMDANFDLRRDICPLNPRQVQMVEAARALGAPCKFAGSGGSVVGLYRDEKQYDKLRRAYQKLGCKTLKPKL